jgi:hypothetical protein
LTVVLSSCIVDAEIRLRDIDCKPEGSDEMVQVQEGQCGLCAHFGEQDPKQPQLIQIRLKHEAPENLVEECGHPAHAPLHLVVTPISGCRGFEPARQVAAAGG